MSKTCMESRIKKMIEAGAVATGVFLSGTDALAQEKGGEISDIQALATFIRRDEAASRREKIIYPDAPLPQKDCIPLVRAIKKFDSDTMSLFGARKAAESDSRLFSRKDSVSRIPTQFEMNQARKKLWHTLVPLVPGLPKTYSDTALFHTLVYDVPRILAPYWMYGDQQLITYGDGVAINALEVRSNIFTIRKKTPLHRTVFDIDVDSSVLQIDKPIGSTTRQEGELANVRYGNIFLQNRGGEKMIAIWNIAKNDIKQALGGFKGDPRSLPDDVRMRNDLVCMLALKDLFARSMEPSVQECEDSHIAHELGHVANKRDSNFTHAFEQIRKLSGEQLLMANINESSHDELDAILASLRYSSNKSIQLFELFTYLLSSSNKTSLSHHAGSLWIRTHVMEEISKEPEKYGITFRNNSPFTEGEQMLLALPRLISEQPQILNSLWESLWKLHREQLSVNLFEASTQSPYSQPESHQKKSDNQFLQIVGLGAGACGIFAALQALRKKCAYMKQEKEKISLLTAQLSELFKDRANGEQLVQDLQLGKYGKDVDGNIRDKAFDEVCRIARSQKSLRQHIKMIRLLIGKEEK